MSSSGQLSLFMRKARIEFPPTQRTADSCGEVEADDGFRYYVKGDGYGRPIRASEWICTNLAEAVGVAAPGAVGIELSNGDTVFGSRRIAGVASAVDTRAYLSTPSASNLSAQIIGLKAILSKIYAFDMFVHNDDRHWDNYISVDDNGVRRIYAFDYSRALFWKWPWSGFVAPGCNTVRWGRTIRALHGFDETAAGAVLDQIEALKTPSIEAIVKQMPSGWLPSDLGDDFLKLFSNGGCQQRVQALRKGLGDGTLL